jgi:uncharacterized protein involved in tolerance to divalent cations
MLIIGVDICADRAVCWPLTEVPKDPKSYWKKEVLERSKDPKEDPLTFYFTKGGIAGLLALKPDAIAMEPTGVHYAKFLWHVCESQGIPILWVGHQQASNQRKSYGLPDKNDLADAFAIACYASLYRDHQAYFIDFPEEVRRIKELYLQLKTLARLSSPLISRLRQQLVYEFPEAAAVVIQPQDGRRVLPTWLCGRDRGKRKHPYWDKRYRDSVAHHYGIEISSYTRKLAEMIDDYDLWVLEIEKELYSLVNAPLFARYNRVFDDFGFGLRARAILLSLVYPFERFESIGAFKRRIGATKDEVSSGKSIAWKTGVGSKLCRTELYLWVYTSICGKTNRPQSRIGKLITDKYDSWIEQTENPEAIEAQIRQRMQSEALQKVKEAFLRAVKPLIPQSETGNLSTVMAMVELSLKSTIDVNTSAEKLKLNRKEAKRRLQNLIMTKTANYAARWLYRSLKSSF